ncbi:MAG: hypothetical protein GY856_54575 [bacterium]|nr:hypothetical protein [bacterium]
MNDRPSPPSRPRRGLVVLSGMIILCAVLAPTTASAKDGVFVLLSDIHFDPFADPELVKELIAAEPDQWEELVAGSSTKGYGAYHDETNYHLLASALRHMKRVAPTPDFILVPGDFLAHNFISSFQEASGSTRPEDTYAFIDKTVAFVTSMIAEQYPKTPIYPALGNNDSYCGNYMIEPAGAFLKTTAATWKSLFRNARNARSFRRSFPTAGNYAVTLPGGKSRLLVLNAIYWSVKYQNRCGSGDTDPAQAQLEWLKAELASAAANRQMVWLLYHIPPGISSFSTWGKAADGVITEVVFFWHPTYITAFLELIQHHASRVEVSFVGHTHMDSFRLLGQQPGRLPAASFVRIAPALTPVFGNNPGFQVFTYDRRTFQLIDYTTEYLDLAAKPAKGWKREYSFGETYSQPALTADTLQAVYYSMLGSPDDYLEEYIRYFDVSNDSLNNMGRSSWPVYWSAAGQMQSDGFLAWYQALTSQPTAAPENQQQ